MDKRFIIGISFICGIYLVINGTYYLIIGEAIPADGSARDFKYMYDFLPASKQGIVDIFFGFLCFIISYFSWLKFKS